MSSYEVRPVVSDHGIYYKGNLMLILNDYNNALSVAVILNSDEDDHKKINSCEYEK